MKRFPKKILLTFIAALMTLFIMSANNHVLAQDTGPEPGLTQFSDLGLPSFTGNFGTVAGGMGLYGIQNQPNPIPLVVSVPAGATDIAGAFLFWAAIDAPNQSHNNVTLEVGTTSNAITADFATTGYRAWEGWGLNRQNYSYLADITDLVGLGDNTFFLDDFNVDTSLDGRPEVAYHRYGFGVIIVYEDPALLATTIEPSVGLDYLYWSFDIPDGPRSSPSNVYCAEFVADATNDRRLEVTFIVAGYDNDIPTELRPHNLWFLTGSGTPPAGDIIGVAGAISTADPFRSVNGLEWDTLVPEDDDYLGQGFLIAPAGSSYACFQIESDNTRPSGALGASILWLGTSVSLRQQTPTAITMNDIGLTEVNSGMVWLMVAFVLLMSATLYFGVLKQRR